MYVPPGFILFLQEHTLMARPFDATRQEFTGDARPVVEGVAHLSPIWSGAFSVSDEGTLVYRTGPDACELRWVDRTGTTVGVIPGVCPDLLRLSPDASRFAYSEPVNARDQNPVVWIHDFERRSRLTIDPATGHMPVWSPDGSRVVFDTGQGRKPREHALYGRPATRRRERGFCSSLNRGLDWAPLTGRGTNSGSSI